ncbi:hypothetical protein ONZ43_g4261 [Nemania bipapillata]|uniref:Uncharacterized protein n=1 Tax=Nemania bipapillata TaxID=110536 RepID=A0ACC2IPZ1_9PEZI|nr:hypothetical protein ONZ43_g4261 [Nemania bipapillata]
MAASLDPAQLTFEHAISDFRGQLADNQLYSDILQVATLDQFHDVLSDIRRKQGGKGNLRGLVRINLLVKRLNGYITTLEALTQGSPEVSTLIWGPPSLILQLTTKLDYSFNAVVDAMEQLGKVLPHFERAFALSDHNIAKEIMVLFFRNLLDFYLVPLNLLKVFGKLFGKIMVILSHIRSNERRMANEILLDIARQEHEDAERTLRDVYQREQERSAQDFLRIKASILKEPDEERLALLGQSYGSEPGDWLLQDEEFKKWYTWCW